MQLIYRSQVELTFKAQVQSTCALSEIVGNLVVGGIVDFRRYWKCKFRRCRVIVGILLDS